MNANGRACKWGGHANGGGGHANGGGMQMWGGQGMLVNVLIVQLYGVFDSITLADIRHI